MSQRYDDTIFVPPGGLHFGREGLLRTILGSCVAVVLWHPKQRIGGMCHYVLPGRVKVPPGPPDPRYGVEALAILARHAEQAGTRTQDYQAYLYGGGRMFPNFNVVDGSSIGDQNIAMARELARHYRLRVVDEDLGGYKYRSITLDLADGTVTLRRTPVVGAE